jgi:hypothetical protein
VIRDGFCHAFAGDSPAHRERAKYSSDITKMN